MYTRILIVLVFVGFTIEDTLLGPIQKCVATTFNRGQCHECMCSILGGIFACSQIPKCTVRPVQTQKRECDRQKLYRLGNTICTCSYFGQWNSENCRSLFGSLKAPLDRTLSSMRTTIQCRPKRYYLVDCNVCRCSSIGLIDFNLCTKRICPKRHKSDKCKQGQVYKSKTEFCVCGDTNGFTDKLCIPIKNDFVQALKHNALANLTYIGKTWKRLDDKNVCKLNITYTIDCNTCSCNKLGEMVCTNKMCHKPNAKEILRGDNRYVNEFYLLPILKSDEETCKPGLKYRYNCNSCICNKVGKPVCTKMICREDLIRYTYKINHL